MYYSMDIVILGGYNDTRIYNNTGYNRLGPPGRQLGRALASKTGIEL